MNQLSPHVARMVEVVEKCLRTVNRYDREDSRLAEDVIAERARNIVAQLLLLDRDESVTIPPPVD